MGITASTGTTLADWGTSASVEDAPPVRTIPDADPPPSSPDPRSRVVALAVLLLGIAIVIGCVLLGNSLANTGFDFASPGVWLPSTGGDTQKVAHIALGTGETDARIDVGGTVGAFTIAADDHSTYLVGSADPCHLDRLDEARLNLAKRDERLSLGPGPCSRYTVAVGGHRVYVIDGQTGQVRQFDPESLAAVAGEISVTAPVSSVAANGDGALVVVGGSDRRTVQVVRDGTSLDPIAVDDAAQVVRAGPMVAVVESRRITWVGDGGEAVATVELAANERIDLELDGSTPDAPGGGALGSIVDQPGTGVAARTLDGAVVVADIDGGPVTLSDLPPGRAVLLGDTVHVLTATGVERRTLDGIPRDVIVLAGDGQTLSLRAVSLQGRLWVHDPASPRGVGCDVDGACTTFDKDTAAVPETKATDPLEPDPPKEVDPNATTTTTVATTATTIDRSTNTTVPVTTPETLPDAPPSTLAPRVATPPGPVTNLRVSPGSESATVTWSPPSSGSAPTRYHVSVDGRERGDVRPPTPGTNRYDVDQLRNGTTYTITVWASVDNLDGGKLETTVVPSDRTPTNVTATVSNADLCSIAQLCNNSDDLAVLVRWAEAPGVGRYEVDCGGGAVTAPARGGNNYAIVYAVRPGPATCTVYAEDGATAAGDVVVVGLPEFDASTDTSPAAPGDVFTIVARDNSGQSLTIDGLRLSGPDGEAPATNIAPTRYTFASGAEGAYTLLGSATNARGSENLSRPFELRYRPMNGLTATAAPTCCNVSVGWRDAMGANEEYAVQVTISPSPTPDWPCRQACIVAGTAVTLPFDRASLWQALAPSTPADAAIDVTVTVTRSRGGTSVGGSLFTSTTLNLSSSVLTSGPSPVYDIDGNLIGQITAPTTLEVFCRRTIAPPQQPPVNTFAVRYGEVFGYVEATVISDSNAPDCSP